MKRIDFISLSMNLAKEVRILALRSRLFYNREKKNPTTSPGEMPVWEPTHKEALCGVQSAFSDLVLILRLMCFACPGKLLALSGPLFPHL